MNQDNYSTTIDENAQTMPTKKLRGNQRFSILQARAVEDRRISNSQFRTLAALGLFGDRDGWCWPRIRTLAETLGKSRQAVNRDLLSLQELGYIEIHHQFHEKDGNQLNNKYRLLFDTPCNVVLHPLQPDVAPPATSEVAPPATSEVAPPATSEVAPITPQLNAPPNVPQQQEQNSFVVIIAALKDDEKKIAEEMITLPLSGELSKSQFEYFLKQARAFGNDKTLAFLQWSAGKGHSWTRAYYADRKTHLVEKWQVEESHWEKEKNERQRAYDSQLKEAQSAIYGARKDKEDDQAKQLAMGLKEIQEEKHAKEAAQEQIHQEQQSDQVEQLPQEEQELRDKQAAQRAQEARDRMRALLREKSIRQQERSNQPAQAG